MVQVALAQYGICFFVMGLSMYHRHITAAPMAVLAWFTSDMDGWLSALAMLALLVTIVTLVAFAVADWRSYRGRGGQRGYRHRRTAHERFAASADLPHHAAEEGRGQAAEGRQPGDDDDELLRQLLGQ